MKGKHTLQRHNRRTIRKHGFMARMATLTGRRILASRRRKGRKQLAIG